MTCLRYLSGMYTLIYVGARKTKTSLKLNTNIHIWKIKYFYILILKDHL